MNGAPLVTVARLKIVGANFITVASEIVDCWSRFNGIRPYSDKSLDRIDYSRISSDCLFHMLSAI